jgi:branched-chain amino acid transport system ATP-binding protein
MLEVQNLTKYFGGLAAVKDLSYCVAQGDIVGLIGPNGAGKTVSFNLLSGFTRPTKGRVIFKGRNITGLPPNRIAALGLVRTWQSNTLVKDRTVYENLLVAHHLQYTTGDISSVFHSSSARSENEKIGQRSRELLGRVGLAAVRDTLAGSLPHGLQRVLQLCIALAANPRLLLLDEPTAGMRDDEITNILGLIQEVRRQGVTILIVEHNVRVVTALCDRIVVLNLGEKIAEGAPEDIVKNKAVIEAYLGSDGGERDVT